MANILIKNARWIFTADRVLRNKDILIENGVVSEFGSGEADRVINGEDKIVMPGLINCNTQTSLSSSKGLSEPERLNPKTAFHSAMIGIQDAISSGTTTIIDSGSYPEQVAKAMRKLGVRGFVGQLMSDGFDPIKKEAQLRRTKENLKFIERLSNPKITGLVALESLTDCSDTLVIAARELATRKQTRISMPVSKNKSEVELVRNDRGETPLMYLKKLEVTKGLMALGGNSLTGREISIANRHKTTIVHCPIAELRNGSENAQTHKLMEKGVNVCIGTGSPIKSNADMFESMRITALLQKEHANPFEILRMATIRPAQMLGLDSGRIEPGSWADLILLDLTEPNLRPLTTSEQLINHLVYSANRKNVTRVIIDGDLVMQDKLEPDVHARFLEGRGRLVWGS
ncbi:MAG: amidohydrolase family protein [Candidatus Altiarchaeota archaeon]|nr:amidohydrolase family protein [Candidatus Altiarchaeota archaeon]